MGPIIGAISILAFGALLLVVALLGALDGSEEAASFLLGTLLGVFMSVAVITLTIPGGL